MAGARGRGEGAEPELALGASPRDPEVVAVYADWLGQKGDPLGEYVTLRAQLDGGRADRRPLAERATELRVAHGREWRRRWNRPYAAFPEGGPTFAGLPSVAVLERPWNPASLDAQLARLPVQRIRVEEPTAEGLAHLGELAALRRVDGLDLRGPSDAAPGPDVATWLAARGLANVTRLATWRVALPERGPVDLVESMPALEGLTAIRAGLDATALRLLGASDGARRLVQLDLSLNELGNGSLEALAAFPALRAVRLASTELDERVADTPAIELGIEKLDLGGNHRLQARGLAGIVAALPAVRRLALDHLTPAALAAIEPLAPRLFDLELFFERDVGAAQVRRFFERAGALRALRTGVDRTIGVATVLEGLTLRRLELYAVDDGRAADLAAAKELGSIEELVVHGAIGDAGAEALARSPNAGRLRVLDIDSRRLGARGVATLLAGLPALEELRIRSARFEDSAPLCAAPPRVWLDLFDCKMQAPVRSAIRAHWAR